MFGLGGVLIQSMDSSPTDGAAHDQSAGDVQQEAGRELEKRVQTLVAAQAVQPSEDGSPDLKVKPSPQDGEPFAGGATTVASCVRNGIDRTDKPIAADASERSEGRPSQLVVFAHPDDPQLVDAYVVDATCATGSEPGPGEVLVQRTYERK